MQGLWTLGKCQSQREIWEKNKYQDHRLIKKNKE